MGIMNAMRTRMKVILWILLILFIGSMSVGGLVGGADIVNQLFGRVDPSKAIIVVNVPNKLETDIDGLGKVPFPVASYPSAFIGIAV